MKRSVLIRLILYSAMICITYWIVRLHLPNPKDRLDNNTLLDIHKYVLDRIGEKPLGEEMSTALKELYDKNMQRTPEYEHFFRNLPVPVVEQANRHYALTLSRQLRDNIAEILRLAKQGVAFPSQESVKEWLESLDQENKSLGGGYYWVYQFCSRSLLIESDMLYKEEKWDEAFQSLKDINTLAHAIGYDSFSGHLYAVALRSQLAAGFKRMLFLNPPPEVDRKALNLLNSLCACHILFDENTATILGMWELIRSTRMSHFFTWEYGSDIYTVSALLHNKDPLKNRNNKNWLKRITKRYAIDTEGTKIYETHSNLAPLLMVNWTFYPSIKKFLGRVGETEAQLIEPFPMVDAFRHRLPLRVVTRLIVYHSLPIGSSPYRSFVRSSTSAVRLELLRIAFATRLYYHDNKRFPDSVEELVPDYIESLPVLEYQKDLFKIANLNAGPNKFLSPMRIKKIQLSAYDFSAVLRLRPAWRYEDRIIITPEGDLEWGNFSEEVANVMADYLKRFDRVIEEVSLKPAQGDKKSIVAKINAPQEFLALYSPGPDRDDDGAMITYDPTNGTVSSGDIIVYPEGFAR